MTAAPDPARIDDLLAFAGHLAEAAAAAILPWFRQPGEVEDKKGAHYDPVTEADRAAERAMRALIEARFPDHDITGEEYGATGRGSDWNWILDPVDGTRSFIYGTPTWMTLIGLTWQGRPVAGLAHQAFTGETFAGGGGRAVWSRAGERRPLRVREAGLAASRCGTTGPHLYTVDPARARAFDRLKQAVQIVRYDADAYFFCMVAAGQVDIAMDTGLQSYDIAALIPIVEGAGGRVTCWDGSDATDGGDILATAGGALHDQVMALLRL